MKKLLLPLTLLLFVNAAAQHDPYRLPGLTVKELDKVAIKYLGFSPFQDSINSILNKLGDQFEADTTIARTDTTLYYIRGYRNNFNPLSENADSIKLIIAEQINKTTGGTIDTILVYQTLIFSPSDAKALRTQYRKIDKTIRHRFIRQNYNRRTINGKLSGESYSYYFLNNAEPQLITSWNVDEAGKRIIVISFRIPPKNP